MEFDPADLEQKVAELASEFREKWPHSKSVISSASSGASPSHLKLPTFYRSVVPDEGDLQFRLMEEARSLTLSRINAKVLDNDEIHELWNLMQKFADSNPADDDTLFAKSDDLLTMSYKGYSLLRRQVTPKALRYLQPSIFASLICNTTTTNLQSPDTIRVTDLFSYVVRSVWLERTRISLSLYDLDGNGFLKEVDLEQYIEELIPTIDTLKSMDPEFRKFYICGVIRKFFFFLDAGHQGKIRILKMLESPLIQELMDVRETTSSGKKNWFSLDTALDVYNDYLSLDRKKNGLLSRTEFRTYPKAALSEAFVQRVFEECVTYEGEMDYKTFLDVILALENKNDPASIRFLFRMLDVRQQGAIDEQTVNFFFKDIPIMLFVDKVQPPSFGDVVSEIFDMVPTRQYRWITLRELLACKLGGTVAGLLIDKDCFLAYEFREQQIANTMSSL